MPIYQDQSDRPALAASPGVHTSSEYPTSIAQDDYNVLQAFRHGQAVLSDPTWAAEGQQLADSMVVRPDHPGGGQGGS